MKASKLYFCDGLACAGGDNCYLSGGDCYHTSNKKHSLTDKLNDIYKTQDAHFYLPTYFAPFSGGDILIETIDEKSFMFQWRSANRLLLDDRDISDEESNLDE
jgi:hypothetical protein